MIIGHLCFLLCIASVAGASWSAPQANKKCDATNAGEKYLKSLSGRQKSLEACQTACENNPEKCLSITYYSENGWCSLFNSWCTSTVSLAMATSMSLASPSPPLPRVWIEDGCHSGGVVKEGRWAATRETIAVAQCCADTADGPVCTRRSNVGGAMKCFGSGKNNNEPMTFIAAKNLCEKIDKRLCTKEETLAETASGCCDNGCGFNHKYVWTSTTENICVCANGTPRDIVSCPSHGANVCASCLDGYTLYGNDCLRTKVLLSSPHDVILPFPNTNTLGGEQVANVFDNDRTTKFTHTQGVGSGVEVRLQANIPRGKVPVVEMLEFTSALGEGNNDPSSYRIEGSVDFKVYNLIAEGDLPRFSGRGTSVFVTVPESKAPYRTYRVVFPKLTRDGPLQIADIVIYGRVVTTSWSAPPLLKTDKDLRHVCTAMCANEKPGAIVTIMSLWTCVTGEGFIDKSSLLCTSPKPSHPCTSLSVTTEVRECVGVYFVFGKKMWYT